MKRVCMLRHSYYPQINPNQRNAETLAARGYEVDVICLKKKQQPSRETVNGVNVHRFAMEHHRKSVARYAYEYVVFFFMAMWKLAWLTLKRKYQVIEVSGIPDFLIFATVVPKLLKAKIVMHVLDHTPGVFADHLKIGAGHPAVRILSLIEKGCAHWADHIITTQSTSRDMLIKNGIPASKITVILNTPDENLFRQLPQDHASNSHFSLVTHGSLVERYCVQTLVKAVPFIVKEIPDLKVKIIGDGEYQPRLEELARSLGVRDYIDFTGRLPFKDIPAQIAQANIGIVAIPTGVNPAMPQKLLEYIAMGKPAVVTSFPTIKAYFDDNTIMYYRSDDERDLARCVIELYRNPEKRAALAAASETVYQNYRWSVMRLEYLKVFDGLTNSTGAPSPETK